MNEITRRAFLAGSAVAVAVVATVAASSPQPDPEPDYPYVSGHVCIGILQEPLHSGKSARVHCPNPYHPGCYASYVVHAGKFISELLPWPTGHPVAFTSVDGTFRTIGW